MSEVIKCTLTLYPTKVFYTDDLSDEPQLTVDIDQDRLRRDTRNWLARRIADRPEECAEEEARLLGRHLYETIFRGKIRLAFEGRVAMVRAHDDWRLRLQLIFHKDTELAQLPWEFLHTSGDDGGDRFLAGEVEQFVLTRFISPPPKRAGKPSPLDRPVKVLLAACTEESSEDSFAVAEIEGLVALLEEAARLADTRTSPDVEVRRLPNPTYAQLRNAVQGLSGQSEEPVAGGRDPWKPDVVHVIGHGEPGAILLRRDAEAIADEQAIAADTVLTGGAAVPVAKDEPVEAALLRNLFYPHRPNFVFLQTCYSDKIDGAELYTTAQRIVREGIPAVLAMQYDIDRGPADKFACEVYEQLLEGKTIDVAVGAGRRRLREPDTGARWPLRAFGTPVVYVGHDGPLVRARQKPRNDYGKANPGPEQGASEPRLCPRCGTKCLYRACSNCALRFFCMCKVPFENPLGLICGNCEDPIQQPPWTPPEVHNGGQPALHASVPAGPPLHSPAIPPDLQQQQNGGDL